MNEPHRSGFGVDNVNRTTIGNVDAQRSLLLIGDKTIIPRKMSIASQRGVDHRNPVPVNLLGRYLRPIRQPQPLSHFAMCTFQPGNRGGFIAPHIDPGDPLDEDSATTSDGIKRRKTFNNAVCATF
jgi:hypothetical protein